MSRHDLRTTRAGQSAAARTPSPRGGSHGPRARLRQAFYLTLIVLAVELAGGAVSHSLALFSDAGHVLTDILALGLAWFAAAQAERPPSNRMTYGYHRIGILTALANSCVLVLIAVVIGLEAWQRFLAAQPVNTAVMAGTAVVPIALNLYIAKRLHGHSHNLNARAAALHVIGDVGASVGVLVAAVAIALTGALWIDPLISALIALLIAAGAVRILTEALNILLEAVPKGLEIDRIERAIRGVNPHIHDVHDVHVWSIGGGMAVLSCHVIIEDVPLRESEPILDGISRVLRDRFGIVHTTIQFESQGFGKHQGYCACPPGSRGYCDIQPVDSEDSPLGASSLSRGSEHSHNHGDNHGGNHAHNAEHGHHHPHSDRSSGAQSDTLPTGAH